MLCLISSSLDTLSPETLDIFASRAEERSEMSFCVFCDSSSIFLETFSSPLLMLSVSLFSVSSIFEVKSLSRIFIFLSSELDVLDKFSPSAFILESVSSDNLSISLFSASFPFLIESLSSLYFSSILELTPLIDSSILSDSLVSISLHLVSYLVSTSTIDCLNELSPSSIFFVRLLSSVVIFPFNSSTESFNEPLTLSMSPLRLCVLSSSVLVAALSSSMLLYEYFLSSSKSTSCDNSLDATLNGRYTTSPS